jgi:hypothetical protein
LEEATMALVDTQMQGAALAAPPIAAAKPAASRAWLFNPWIDFFCLGGGSLLVLGVVALLIEPTPALRVEFAAVALLVAHVINHPHFAHSYQIFYGGFRRKAFGDAFEAPLRLRYVFAGIAVPLLLIAYFAVAIAAGDARALGYTANAMFFLVGWHYVKQGYGMAMLDAVLKKRFFTQPQKRILLWNGYSGWLLSWLLANRLVFEFDYWGLAYYSFATPQWLIDLSLALAIGTGASFVLMVLLKGRSEGWRLGWNGLLGYVASIYIWLLAARISPLFVLFVPAFHSLQYLVVVWRYQVNRAQAAPDRAERPLGGSGPGIGVLRLVLFLVVGIVFGWLGFWGLPRLLDANLAYDHQALGPTTFLFVFWIFINVHHYFLDNVMWRRENPETRRFLFGAK